MHNQRCSPIFSPRLSLIVSDFLRTSYTDSVYVLTLTGWENLTVMGKALQYILES